MGKPLMDDPSERVAEVVDLFARGGDGRSNGIHRVQALLQTGEKGPLNSIGNLMVILSYDPPLAGLVGYDDFTSQHLLMRAPPPLEEGEPKLPGPYPRAWGIADVSLVQSYIQRVWKILRANRADVESAMITTAEHHRFHPVRDWLKTLEWDGKPRLDTWLSKAFGCKEDEYHAAIGSKFLIAAVRRVRHPGCKFDHMPVLEGPQGLGKSTVCKELFGPAWFSDAMPEELASKDAAMALLGIWVLEFAEIQHLIRNEVEVIKAFLSRSTDRYRPPYGKSYVERPRQGVLIGTTNTTDYLRDSSGNRRIWPVRCTYADASWVAENRKSLWAEAASREASGEAIWLHEDAAQKQASQEQEDRMTEDAWVDLIEPFLVGKIETNLSDIMSQCLQIPRERQGRREQMRVADILKSEGWIRSVTRDLTGKQKRVWEKKERHSEAL